MALPIFWLFPRKIVKDLWAIRSFKLLGFQFAWFRLRNGASPWARLALEDWPW
jgi:hypothetical protein